MKHIRHGVQLIILLSAICFSLIAFGACTEDSTAAETKSGAGTAAAAADVKVEKESSKYDVTTRTENPPIDSKANYLAWMIAHTDEDQAQLSARWDRAAAAIAWKDLTREDVIHAFLRTPREYFAREKNWNKAYNHTYLDIGYGQTISGPHLVAKMTCELDLKSDDKVLEIGTGSGYQSAVLSQLSNYVYTIEVIEPLGTGTDEIYTKYTPKYPEFGNITRKVADGYYGWEEYAPFDKIIVTCGIDHIPPALIKQMKPEGLMLIPVGPISHQHVLKIIKHVDGQGNVTLDKSDIYNGREVPFVNFTSDGKTAHSISADKPNQ